MFKFYQPEKKEQRMIDVKKRDERIVIDDGYDCLISFNFSEARLVAQAILSLLPTPDPALILAQRIASISAETGLKPGMVGRIIQSLKWEAEAAAEKAKEAAAPQENQPNA
jgi:hypothetical protein